MQTHKEWLAPCGLYCGVCGILMATRDNNEKFKERLAGVYNLKPEEIYCEGCLSEKPFVYCRVCAIKFLHPGKRFGRLPPFLGFSLSGHRQLPHAPWARR